MSVRVVVFGTSTFGLPSFERITQDERFELVAIVTQPAKPTGRHQTIMPSPVEEWGRKKDVPVLTPKTLKTTDSQTQLRDLKSDIFLVASYGLILPQGVLDIPAFGCLNIHASLLPKYRGASPISGAILEGDQETGITFMSMDAGCDTGPILQQSKVDVALDETRLTLENKLSELAAASIVQVIHDWQSGGLNPQPQPEQGVSSAPRLTRENGRAVWDDATKLERQIRAYQPWPGLWTTWKNTELKILSATTIAAQPTEIPGTIVLRDQGWAIACRDGYLVPTTVQFSGKKLQPAKNIPGSYPDFIDSRLD